MSVDMITTQQKGVYHMQYVPLALTLGTCRITLAKVTSDTAADGR
jgi:hypothetical protein